MALAEAKKLKGVVMTESPGCTPTAAKREPEGIGAGGAANGVGGAGERGEFAFERLDFRAQDEMLRGTHPFDSGQDLRADCGVLPAQVEHGHARLRGRGALLRGGK